jgi:hypothetical protein
MRLFILSLLLIAPFVLSAQCYQRLSDQTGYVPNAQQIAQIQAAACRLLDSIPQPQRDSFRIIEIGFYLHTPVTDGGVPEAFTMAKAEAASIPSKPYYLLICKQADQNGLCARFWVDLKLPLGGEFSCLNLISPSQSLRSDLTFKFQYIANSIHDQKGNKIELYHEAVAATIDSLTSRVREIKECCENQQKGATGCGACVATPDEISYYFVQKGYKAIPVKIVTTFAAKSEGSEKKMLNTSVEDYAEIIYELGGYRFSTFSDNASEMNRLKQPPYENMAAKAFITKNENLCDITLKGLIDNDFGANQLAYGIHEHVWDSPGDDYDLKFIKYYPEAPKVTAPSGAVTSPAVNRPSECAPIPLFPAILSNQSYAVSFDPSLNRYRGYKKINNNWHPVSIVEYTQLPVDDPDMDRVINDRTASRTFIARVPFNLGFATIFIDSFTYFPSKKAFDLATIYSTTELVNTLFGWFVNAGTQAAPQFRDEFEYVFQQFKYGKGVVPVMYHCDNLIAQDATKDPALVQFLQSSIDPIITDWLTNHDDLDSFFTDPSILLRFQSLNSPNLRGKFWINGLFGGTQGFRVQVRNFTKDTCVRVEYIITIYDTFSFGNTDGDIRRPPIPLIGQWLTFPGLIEGWVLQHHRNFDDTYCPNPPCFCPVTFDKPNHFFETKHSLNFCP